MPSILLIIYFLLQLILSFVLCFFGYSQIRTLISAYGFIAGFAVCYSLLLSTTLPALAIYVISFLAGSTVSGAAYFLYRLAMFAAGAGLGIAAGAIISTALGLDLLSTLSLIIMAGLGVAAGALSIGYKRLVIILSTAVCGALMLSVHGGYMIYQYGKLGKAILKSTTSFSALGTDLLAFFHNNPTYLLGAAAVLAVAGLITQFKKTGKEKK